MARWKSALNRLIPGHCHLCTAVSDDLLCSRCQGQLPLNDGTRCQRCDLPTLSATPECSDCQQGQTYFGQNLSAYRFEFPIDVIINRQKNGHQHFWMNILCRDMVERIDRHYGDNKPDLLCPIPIHWLKRLTRGYNQSAIICQHLSIATGIPWAKLLKKTRATPAQKDLSKNKRAYNLANSFVCTTKAPPQHVALVDDVMTTGATAETAAKIFREAGAAKVDIWTLARTPKPEL